MRGSGFGLAMAFLAGAAGCEAPRESPMGVLAEDEGGPGWRFAPLDDGSRSATGPIGVEPLIEDLGPGRRIVTARGDRLVTRLVGPYAGQLFADDPAAAASFGLKLGDIPLLHQVTEIDAGLNRALCGDRVARFVMWREPEMIESRRLALAVFAGAPPDEPGATLCRVLRYERRAAKGDSVEGAMQ